ncbi:hypothetical protein GQ43DRAFT_440005 [Delitschia confertaspora ATCC 74209]|uniref:Cyclin n=1 Tax=Delitschia confertaspora ATCC 74209 TaxID=1513339 RepID=A0A9P4JMN9_9PLEO|nr:hypothetical protein GQ43DRAFT_440005 [Delitschia confertaspora ATCC 74209]
MVEVIWPLSVPSVPSESASGRGVLPLRTFIQETLRRSRTSYSTLQVALYYLVLIKEHVPKHDFTMEQPEDVQSLRALQCGRRMFLAALILASKYLQDRNFSARAWSKISSLQVCEINSNEIAFLSAVNWKLHITEPVWERWQEVVLRHAPSNPPSSPGACVPNSWKDIIPHLTPELDMAGIAPRTPVTPAHAEFKPEIRRSPLRYTLPLPLPDASSSAESTPTPAHYQAPRFLEPKPDLLPPTPSLIRMGPLPTPLLTPQSIASSTPAASVLGLGSRRPSMCTAMAQAQSSSLARLCVDQFNPSAKNGLEEYHFPSRRPSLAPSTSSTSSSPESMVTDNSRSSRASSISSVSSAGCAPNPAKLARLATCRSARLQYPALQKCPEASEYSSPDLESFHIDDADVSPSFKAHGTADSVSAISRQARKRGISSVDMQQQVRQLLQRSTSTTFSEDKVVRDQCDAVSFMLQDLDEPKGLQFPARTVSESRVPIQKDLGRKRTCCGSSAVPSNNWQQLVHSGPGMWQGIL